MTELLVPVAQAPRRALLVILAAQRTGNPGGMARVRNSPVISCSSAPLESAVEPHELATEVQFPVLPHRAAGTGFTEVSRRRGDYAICGVATMAWLGTDGHAAGAKAAYLSMAPSPVVLDLTEAVAGAAADAKSFPAAARLAREQLEPQPDIHATARYRRQLAGVLTERALAEALADARETIDAEQRRGTA
jgi:carbon-monoxide dehydrogenase medium subunit